jgi:hypothetical protein
MSNPGRISRLDDSVTDYIGNIACARPIYGWGWAEGNNERSDTVPVEVPGDFDFRIIQFFDWNGYRRGGIGHIERAGHIYDACWLLFYTRHVGCFDFSKRIADYNFHIGRDQPSLYPPSKDPKMAEAWPLPCFARCSSTWGYGKIAMSREAIETYECERLEKWQAEKRIRKNKSGTQPANNH